MATFKRKYLRAPVYRLALYQDENDVFKGNVKNISQGGILLSELGHLPAINSLPMMIELPIFPEFNTICSANFDFAPIVLKANILRVRAKIVRSFQGKSDVDMLFQNVGCEFVRLSDENREKINNYVKRYARNLVFLLGLFENMAHKKNHPKLIRYFAAMLGHDTNVKLPILRMKLMHDYQSIEGL